jgi:hypothetical protein
VANLEASIDKVRSALANNPNAQDAMDNIVFSLKLYRDNCKEWDRNNQKWRDEGL